jgi:precorrin-2 dehydrogenase/sirohydrochlorin ferrochelatase
MATTDEFPAVEGGGSLILAWQVRNKKVLVIGGGEVSTLASNSD